MHLRNGPHGYGAVTKLLHWLTVALLAAQFAVGYTMEVDGDVREVDCDPPGEDRSGGDTSDAEEDRLDRIEDACEAAQERREDAAEDQVGTAWSDLGAGDLLGLGDGGPGLHVRLGLLIIGLGLLRVIWRSLTPLPPWSPRLGPGGRRAAHATEAALLALLFVVPLTGIALVAGADDLVALHVGAHIAFFVALGAHLAVVVGNGLVPRMLPGRRVSGP